MRTRADLIRAVLRKLQVSGVGREPTAEDAAIVDQAVDETISDLDARNVSRQANHASLFGDTETFHDAIFPHLVVCIAARCAPEFGGSGDETAFAYAAGKINEIARVDQIGPARLRIDPGFGGL